MEEALSRRPGNLRFRDVPSKKFNWFDCWSIIKVELEINGSPLNKKIDPNWVWNNPFFSIHVDQYDMLRAIFAFTPRPNKQAKLPKPTLRPWETDDSKFGTATPIADLGKYLDVGDILGSMGVGTE